MRRIRKHGLFITFTGFLLWQIVAFLTATFPCQKATIDDLCTSWKYGTVEGDWCFHLCEAQKSCHGITHFGKQLVVRLQGPFGKAVVKGHYARWDNSSDIDLRLDPTNPTEDFELRVAAYIRDVQNTEGDDALIRKRIASLAVSEVQRKNFLQLMHQREFVWSFLYSQRPQASPFPQLRGTCGHLFIVEESDEILSAVSRWPAGEKLKAMLKVAELIMTLEEQDVQICDFKWEHFGLFYSHTAYSHRDDLMFTIKPLDLDAVFTRQSLKLTLENYKCKFDDDCDFFDCKGQCVKGDGIRESICVASRTDSNIKRFLKLISGSYLPPQRSLLDGIQNENLVTYVQSCQTSTCDVHVFRQLILDAMTTLQ